MSPSNWSLTKHRFLVHANIPFSASENAYFRDFLHSLRPSYDSPSRYRLTHTILTAESSSIHLMDGERLEQRNRLTFLFDGWEDRTRRSLYGAVAAEIDEHPLVLSLEDMTGIRATADNLFDAAKRALKQVGLEDGKKIIACTTDNPSVMQKFRRKFQEHYYWVLVS